MRTTELSWGQAFDLLATYDDYPVGIQREGWNGKGMFVVGTPGYRGLEAGKFWSIAAKAWARRQPEQKADILPYFLMKGADDKFFAWQPNLLDLSTNDWQIIDVRTNKVLKDFELDDLENDDEETEGQEGGAE